MKLISADIIDAAQKAQLNWSIPASVTLAQWALESDWGVHMPPGSNNPFGIKARPNDIDFVTISTREFYANEFHIVKANFKKFDSIADAFDYHGKLLSTGKPYAKIKQYCDQPLIYAQKLTGIYATDPSYGDKLCKVMKEENLMQYDVVKAPSKAPQAIAVATVASSAALVATHNLVTTVPHFTIPSYVYIGLGIGISVFAEVVYFAIRKQMKPAIAAVQPKPGIGEDMIRPEVQPLIDAATALAAKAAKADDLQTQLDAANAKVTDLQGQVTALNTNDADSDAALAAALDVQPTPAQ